MNPIVQEWMNKAEGDYRTASREFRAIDEPNYDAVCYHAQQCIEKLMKAVLIAKGITPPRTHHLIVLDEMLRESHPTWSWSLPDLRALSLASVQFRYPGGAATQIDAEQSLNVCRAARQRLSEILCDIGR